MAPTPTHEMEQVRARLAEIARELEDLEERSPRRAELIEEEHRLQTRLQQLTDDSVSENEGAAEKLVDEEGASADEMPKLPDEDDDG
jgi:predicted nuclease with TOPRIM domain